MSLLRSALKFVGREIAASTLANAGREVGTAIGKKIGRIITPDYDKNEDEDEPDEGEPGEELEEEA